MQKMSTTDKLKEENQFIPKIIVVHQLQDS